MRREALVAGLDLGSTKTCAVIAEAVGDARAPAAKVLGIGLARTTGVKRGMVRDIEETQHSIIRAMKDAERMAGVDRAPPIYCGMGGQHVQTRGERGLVSVTGSEIARADVNRVNQVARDVKLGDDFELLHSIPQEYKVDGHGGISDPVGMTGLRLEVDMLLVAVQSQTAQNLRRAVERAGYGIAELVLEPLAVSLAVLTDEERELGCALVELGGGSTDVAVFHDGKLKHLESIQFAGRHVTGDLVQGLGVTQSDAERLKERWGAAYTPMVSPDEMIDLPGTPGQGPRQANRELLAHIIQARLDEIFGLVAAGIERAGYAGRLPAGMIVTGGGAQLPGVVELGREAFAMPIRKGMPEVGVKGLVDSVQAPKYAVPVGLALYGAGRRVRADDAVGKILGPVKRWLQDFF